MLLDYGFQAIGLDKIVAIVKPQNTASQRVIDKLELVYQKRLQGLSEKHKFFEGLLYYSLSREEYIGKKGVSLSE